MDKSDTNFNLEFRNLAWRVEVLETRRVSKQGRILIVVVALALVSMAIAFVSLLRNPPERVVEVPHIVLKNEYGEFTTIRQNPESLSKDELVVRRSLRDYLKVRIGYDYPLLQYQMDTLQDMTPADQWPKLSLALFGTDEKKSPEGLYVRYGKTKRADAKLVSFRQYEDLKGAVVHYIVEERNADSTVVLRTTRWQAEVMFHFLRGRVPTESIARSEFGIMVTSFREVREADITDGERK